MAVAAVGRPTRERAALSELAEACQFLAADHARDCEVLEAKLALLDAFVAEMKGALTKRRQQVESDRLRVAHVVNRLHVGIVHPSLLGPGNEETAADTAASDDYPQEEEVA